MTEPSVIVLGSDDDDGGGGDRPVDEAPPLLTFFVPDSGQDGAVVWFDIKTVRDLVGETSVNLATSAPPLLPPLETAILARDQMMTAINFLSA